MMYTVSVNRNFTASHYLVGGNWGAENERHRHCYRLEVCLEGSSLDSHEYLVDIVEVEAAVDRLVSALEDKTLNDAPGFKDRNPSIELLATLFCRDLAEQMHNQPINAVKVTVWENESAWASFRLEV